MTLVSLYFNGSESRFINNICLEKDELDSMYESYVVSKKESVPLPSWFQWKVKGESLDHKTKYSTKAYLFTLEEYLRAIIEVAIKVHYYIYLWNGSKSENYSKFIMVCNESDKVKMDKESFIFNI